MKQNEFINTVALIPVRAGSRRVPNKNIALVGGLTLLERKIIQLQQASISEIYVGSDSDEYLSMAEKRGAIPIVRDPVACDEEIASANEMIADFANRIDGDKTVIWCHCTNPFIYASFYKKALETYFEKLNSGDCDSLISVFKMQSHMWNHMLQPANYSPYLARHTLAKQLDPVYFQDGGIFIQSLMNMKKNSYFFGAKPTLFELDYLNSYDINTEEELATARMLVTSMDQRYLFNHE